jgi:hypothetical protein
VGGVQSALGCALVIAAVSTFGDFVWAGLGLRHRVPYGLAHGTLLFAAVGLVLGTLNRRARAGTFAGALLGLLAAGSFYLLFPVLGIAMFAVWFVVWIALGVLYDRLGPHAGLAPAIGRGLGAAVLSGVSFYFISGIWFPFNPTGLDYVVHFGAWALAYLPGFAVLLVANRSAGEISR